MKKVMVLLLLIASNAASFSQKKDSAVSLTRADYLQKSKNQKSAAWLLTGGAVAIGIGALVHDMNNLFTDASGSTGLYIVSAALLTAGITFFVISARTKSKAYAMSLFMHIEELQTVKYAMVRHHPLPSLGISVRF
jgi:hypothetical protein